MPGLWPSGVTEPGLHTAHWETSILIFVWTFLIILNAFDGCPRLKLSEYEVFNIIAHFERA